MPIYEYACDSCGHEFELLVRNAETPACPECASEALTRKLSLPRVQPAGTRQKGPRVREQPRRLTGPWPRRP